MKRVSIVMPTYNRGYCLGDTIQSVLSQSYREWELLVIDNMSKDNTKDVIESFEDARIKMIQIQNHGVIAISRNCGIAAATGELVSFMDSDDPWLPEKLEVSVRLIESGMDFVYHDLYLTDGKDRSRDRTTKVSRRLRRNVLEDLITNGNGINTSSVVTRTELVRRVNGFSESRELIGIEDYDLWVRLAEVTDRFGLIASPMGYYTMDGSGTLNRELVEKGLLNIAKLHSGLHMRICGGTPGWIDIALAKICLRHNPANSIRLATRVLTRESRLAARVKALAIVLLAIGMRVGKTVRKRIK